MNHAGDHKTGNHEEDVNTHEPARHRQSGMKRHNQQNRDCSKSLDVGPAAAARRQLNGPSFAFQVKNVPLPPET
jgi:hypothetical protein